MHHQIRRAEVNSRAVSASCSVCGTETPVQLPGQQCPVILLPLKCSCVEVFLDKTLNPMLLLMAIGETSVVQTQQTVTAAAGGEAHLSCRLTQPKDVLQVTWQKIVSGSEENIGSYSELYGERVVPKFRGKVLISPGMQNSSIVVRNVSEEDGGCFLCLFNAYPEGSLKGRTCLQVYGKKMPELLQSGLDVDPGPVHIHGRLALILTGVIGTVLISALIFFMWRRHSQKRSFWGEG